jgi:hypothetical protein
LRTVTEQDKTGYDADEIIGGKDAKQPLALEGQQTGLLLQGIIKA